MKICFCQGIVLGFEHNVIVFAKWYLGFNRIVVCPIVLGLYIYIYIYIYKRCQNNIGLL